MIKWGKEHSKFNLVDLTPYRFEYFFFAGPDLFAKHKGRNEYSYIKNFGYCLRDWVSWKTFFYLLIPLLSSSLKFII